MGAPYSTSVAGFSTVLVLRAAAIDPSVGPRRPDTIHTNYTPGAAGVPPDSGAERNPGAAVARASACAGRHKLKLVLQAQGANRRNRRRSSAALIEPGQRSNPPM